MQHGKIMRENLELVEIGIKGDMGKIRT